MKTAIKHTLVVLALFASTVVAEAQMKIGSNPTVTNPNANLEVEASTPNRKVKVDKTTGQVTIQDGTEGTGKILTSDAVGGASWQTNTTLRIPEVVWIGEQAGSYTVTPFVGPHDALKDRVPLVPRSGSLPGYNAATKQYTIQASGYYRLYAGASLTGTGTAGSAGAVVTDYARIYIGFNNNYGVLHQFSGMNSAQQPYLSVFWEGYLNAGEVYDIYILDISSSTPLQNTIVQKAFLSITKLF